MSNLWCDKGGFQSDRIKLHSLFNYKPSADDSAEGFPCLLAAFWVISLIYINIGIEEFLKKSAFCQPDITSTTIMQREILAFIQEHYAEKITLTMLAKEFHLSEKYISWYFKEHFAISFMQYVSHLRMTRAKDLLLSTEQSITEIALSSGYPSVNFFIRSFKEEHGITPLQYRKRMKRFTQ